MTTDEIVAGYHKHWTTQAISDFWAWEAVDELCRDLKQGFDITLRLINSADDEAYLAYVAAGPLEDLINRHGSPAVRLFEVPAENSDKVRRALAGVWITPASAGFEDMKRLMSRFGFVPKNKRATKMRSSNSSNWTRRNRRAG